MEARKVKLIVLSSLLLAGCEGVPMPGDLVGAALNGDIFKPKVVWPSAIDGQMLTDEPRFGSPMCQMIRLNAGKTSTGDQAEMNYYIQSCRGEIAAYDQRQVEIQNDEKQRAEDTKKRAIRNQELAKKQKIEDERIAKETQEQNAKIMKEREAMNARLPKGYSVDWDRTIAISIRNIRAGNLTFNDVKKKYQIGPGSGYRVSQVTGDWVIFEGYGDMPLIMERPSGVDILEGWDIGQVGYFFEIMGTKEYPTVLGASRQAVLIEPRYLKPAN